MTITVVTPEHGNHTFDANDWRTVEPDGQDYGYLWIGDEDTDIGVAAFAPGAWLFVYENATADATELLDPPRRLPRVWEDLNREVPIGVNVSDKQGDIWKYSTRHGWQCWMDGVVVVDIDPERYSPYTEVVE